MQKTLHINLLPSQRMVAYLWCLHIFALISFSLLDWPFALLGMLMTLVLISALYYHRKYSSRNIPTRVAGLVVKRSSCQLILENGRQYQVFIEGRQFVSNFLVVLKLRHRVDGLPRYLALNADAVEPNLFRQLKVRLRFPLEQPT